MLKLTTPLSSDGKADYVWTRARDGAVFAWLNNYPNQPPWLEFGQIADGVGTTGSNVKWAELTRSGYPDYVAFNPADGSFAAWLNLCPRASLCLIQPPSHRLLLQRLARIMTAKERAYVLQLRSSSAIRP